MKLNINAFYLEIALKIELNKMCQQNDFYAIYVIVALKVFQHPQGTLIFF